MSTDTNVAVTTDAAPQLKSTDTSHRATVEAPKVETPKEVKPEPVKQDVVVAPPEGESDAPDADSPQAREKRMPRWMKERLERERQVTEARTREAMLREFQSNQPKPEAPVADEPKAKTLEDFNFDQDAYVKHLVKQEREREKEAERLEAENKKRAEAAESFKSRVDAFEERAGDGTWQDIVESPLNTDPSFKSLTDMFMGDEHDLDIAHHLASNLKEALRIRDLPKLQQVRELAKLAEKFEGGSQTEVTTPSPAPLPKKTTTAPPPPKTVSGSGKPSVDINDPGLSTEQRIAAWRAKRRG